VTDINSDIITLRSKGILKKSEIKLSASKSESNRSLIINALSGNLGEIKNLSDARDTQTMERLLSSQDLLLDVLDAGTAMRFLTGYLAVTTKEKKILTGSARMQERPIAILVDALREIGADISYQKRRGYPPLEIAPFGVQKAGYIRIPSNISSQYISALLMIGPKLPKGLTVELVGEIYSEPYIRMTLSLMKKFGVNHRWEGQVITIPSQQYTGEEYTIESDWSGASYWYSFVALAKEGTVNLPGLRKDSFQGDRKIITIMEEIGVRTEFLDDGVRLAKSPGKQYLEIDFKDCPDLAQTVIVACAAIKIPLKMTGLESLKIKETDRIAALQKELAKVNVSLTEKGNCWHLNSSGFALKPNTIFETYDDHRMAMAFAPFGLIAPIVINDPNVVDKSYPGFWKEWVKLGGSVS